MSQSGETLGIGPETVVTAIQTTMEQIAFGRWLGLEFTGIEDDRVFMRFDMRPELVGNPERSALHGGVISAVLDTVGGLATLLGVLARGEEALDELTAWPSTIDLRTDYLRPGIGDYFTARGFPLRVGNRLVVTRMELHGPEGDLIAVGTGTYVLP